MRNLINLDEKYSTTRLLQRIDPSIVLQEIKAIQRPQDKFETRLFLRKGQERKGEGGLRTKNYFKKSYENKPLVTIVTVVYNGEKYLEETILSVINQTYDNVEYIIIDGGSTDGTLDIIKKYEDKIDYWVSEKDKGIYDAMNKGISLTTGDMVGLINADDWYELDALHNVIKNKNNGVMFGKMISHFKDGTIHFHDYIEPRNKDEVKMSRVHPTVFIDKTCYKIYGLFDTTFKLSADYELLLRFYEVGIEFKKMEYVISNFREGGMSGNGKGSKESYIIAKKYKLNNYILFKKLFSIYFSILKRTLRNVFPIVFTLKRKYFNSDKISDLLL